MKTSNWAAATALAGALVVTAATGLSAVEHKFAKPSDPIKPFQAIRLDDGVKHMVGYFRPADGKCKLTLMIGDTFHENDVLPASADVRARFLLNSGETARFDTAAGKQARFECLQGAQAMKAGLSDQFAQK